MFPSEDSGVEFKESRVWKCFEQKEWTVCYLSLMAIVVLSTVTVRVTGVGGSHWQEKTKQCREIHNKRSLGYDSVVEPLPRTHQVPGSTPTLKWRVGRN